MTFKSDVQIVANALSDFYEDTISRKKPVINQEPLHSIISQLELEKLITKGGLTGKLLDSFLQKFFTYSTRLHHPNYFGHQCAAPHYSASLGALINGFTNSVSAIYEMSPVSVSIEYVLINWMLEKIGWEKPPLGPVHDENEQEFGGGVLLDGGSIANLTALLIARSHAAPEVWEDGNPENLTILIPSESHYSLTKAAGILGLGAKSVYFLPTDRRGAIISDKIPEIYQKVLDDGKHPIALVANACSTSVGVYDPLDEAGEFCRDHGLWFHVDGAHGASALLSKKHKNLLRGVQKADSLIWDAHKLLQTPSLCAALLVRDHTHLDLGIKTNQEASYLFHEKNQPGVDFIHRTIETTKSAIGTNLFFVLAALGEEKMEEYIDKQSSLTRQAYDYIRALDDFECPVKPESNILCFRINGDDQLQLNIRNQLTMEQSFYITTAIFNHRRYLRLVFMSPATTIETVIELVSEIVSIKEKLVASTGTNPK